MVEEAVRRAEATGSQAARKKSGPMVKRRRVLRQRPRAEGRGRQKDGTVEGGLHGVAQNFAQHSKLRAPLCLLFNSRLAP